MAVDRLEDLRTETSRAEIYIYTHGDDPILTGDRTIKATSTASDGNHSLVSLQTSKVMGLAAGNFTATIKERPGTTKSLGDQITDDDWVDIVFTKWGRPYHVMRGLVDSIGFDESVSAEGATQRTWTILGRDFGKIWEQTPVFFNRNTQEGIIGGGHLAAFAMQEDLFGDPSETVETFLKEFLRLFQKNNRVAWQLPQSAPNGGGRYFIEVVKFLFDDYDGSPAKDSLAVNMVNFQNASLWELAQFWSDPQFTELYVDTVHRSTENVFSTYTGPFDVGDTQMVVVFRDRPFPTFTFGVDTEGELEAATTKNIRDSKWWTLETSEVRRQELIQLSVGRSGGERKNAFFGAPKFIAGNSGNWLDMANPHWDPDAIKKHGLRRLDYVSNYMDEKVQPFDFTRIHKERLRDWFSLNPYFYNGTISLGHLRPDIRIGTKIKIPGEDQQSDLIFYCEGVSHSWELGIPRTNLTVTRGWRGDDNSLVRAMVLMKDRFREAKSSNPDDDVLHLDPFGDL